MPSTDSNADKNTLNSVLGRVRQRVRNYVLAESVLLVSVMLGVAFWLGLLLDWSFEPSPPVRLVGHVLVATLAISILLRWGVSRWFARLGNRSLALMLERRFSNLNDQLSVAVDLGESTNQGDAVHPELASRTMRGAAEAAAKLDIHQAFNRPRLSKLGVIVSLFAFSVMALALGAPDIWHTFKQRLALSPDEWPRRVELSLEGFEPDGQGGWVRKAARNSDVPIKVRAALTGNHSAPERVSIRYRWNDGGKGRDELIRIGDASTSGASHQQFEYVFERITGDVAFSLRGGDDRIRSVYIEAVERPKVTQLEFKCTYPKYLGRSERTLTVGPRMELPEGTRIRVIGSANKPLQNIAWQTTTDDGGASPETSEDQSLKFEYDLQLANNDVDLQVGLLDEDGIESAEPFAVSIRAKRDLKPQVQVIRDGIGTAVTPHAKIPLQVAVEDDYGVQSASIAIARGEEPLATRPVALPNNTEDTAVALAAVDLRDLIASDANDTIQAIAIGQRLTFAVSADDRYNLTEESRLSLAPLLSFEVVSPEDLVARLSAREQNLRQTFEAVADRLLLLYDSLERMEPEQPSATSPELAADGQGGANITVPTDPIEFDKKSIRREVKSLAEKSRQISDEVLGIAGGFENIHAQLRNNRIEDTELANRIGNLIAKPLRELAEMRMRLVEERILAVNGRQPTIAEAKAETRLAIVEVEKLLREMQGLENYNEVVAMLRDIIRQQDRLHSKTTDKQKSKLRDLLLD